MKVSERERECERMREGGREGERDQIYNGCIDLLFSA